MTNLFFFYLYFTIWFSYIHSVFIIIEKRESRCISRDMKKDDYFSGFYVTSGESETGASVSITNSLNTKLWEVHGQKSGSFSMSISTDDTYNLCIENNSESQIVFSFEFAEEKKDELAVSIRKSN